MPNSQGKTVLLLKPRGFCAGVVRAIDVVRIALEAFGPPIYVRKEIVHNSFVVDELRGLGKCPSTGASALRTMKVMDTVLEGYYGGREDEFWKRPDSWPGRRHELRRI